MPPLAELHIRVMQCLDRWKRKLVQCAAVGSVELFDGYVGVTDVRGTRPPVKNDWGIGLDWVPVGLISIEFEWNQTGIGRAIEDLVGWGYIDALKIVVDDEFLNVAKFLLPGDRANTLGSYAYRRMDGKIVSLSGTEGTKQRLITIAIEGKFSNYLPMEEPIAAFRINNRGVDCLYQQLDSRKSNGAGAKALIMPTEQPVEEWYTLAIFGCRAVTTLEDDPRFRDKVRTLAAQLRAAVTKAKLVSGGADHEAVYLAVHDCLVGEYKLSAKEADQTPVAAIIPPLSYLASKPPPEKPTKQLTNQELWARAFSIILSDRQISPTNMAKQLGVKRPTLYRSSPRWDPIRKALKASSLQISPGFKSGDGELDTWKPVPPKSAQ